MGGRKQRFFTILNYPNTELVKPPGNFTSAPWKTIERVKTLLQLASSALDTPMATFPPVG
jgi:hypothetical protein